MREIIFPDANGVITAEGQFANCSSLQGLINAVEAVRGNPDDCKDYEDNYQTGWWDACNAVLGLLHDRLTHDNPTVENE